MTIGPDIADVNGNAMNQDGDGVNGDTPDDQYIASTMWGRCGRPGGRRPSSPSDVSRPGAVHVQRGDQPGLVCRDDVTMFRRSGGLVIGVVPVAGTRDTQFDVNFPIQSAPGPYTMTIGPDIADPSGNNMNQNNNGLNGEPSDTYTLTRTITSSQVFNSSDVNKPIADATRTISVLTINQNFTITDLNVTMNLSHTWDSDLPVTLVAPDGTQRILVNRRGGSGDNFNLTRFDDEAVSSVVNGAAQFNGFYRPEQSLTGFDGRNAFGTWQLVIDDLAALDVGRVNAWSLTIQS